jgi:hypothetical protein
MERRRATRRTVVADEPLAHAKLRTGRQLIVVDVSNWGALAETTERLLPGRHVDVHIVTPTGRTLVRSRVARAYVCHLQPDAICYRAALAFEQSIDARVCGHSMSAALASLPTSQGRSYPDQKAGSDIEFNEPMPA